MKTLLFLVLLYSTQGFARPFWTEKSIYEEGNLVYVVGIGSDAKTEEEGRLKSLDSAKNELKVYLSIPDTKTMRFHVKMTYSEKDSGKYKVWRLIYLDKNELEKKEEKVAEEKELTTYQSQEFHNDQTCSLSAVRKRINSVKEIVDNYVSCNPIGNGAAFQGLISDISQNKRDKYYLYGTHVCTSTSIFDIYGKFAKTSVHCW